MTSRLLSEGLRERLFSLVGKGDQARVAGFAGLNPSTLSRWRTGAEPLNPRLDTIEKLAEAVGRPARWLLGVEEPEPALADESSYLTVPLLRDTVAAGQPRVVESQIITRLPFSRYWVRKRIGAVPREGRLILVRVDEGLAGWSMIPTILPGNMLLVDRGPGGEGLQTVENGKIYLLQIDGGLTVKRCYLAGEHLVATPDNRTPEHDPVVLELRGRRLQEIVKGRVIWVANQDV